MYKFTEERKLSDEKKTQFMMFNRKISRLSLYGENAECYLLAPIGSVSYIIHYVRKFFRASLPFL